jgi:hypothetical protein
MKAPWLILGVTVGLLVTGAAVVAVETAIRSDPPQAGNPPRFVEETAPDHVYNGEFQHFVGGGVAAFDCNDDGFPELYFAGGAEPSGLYLNQSTTGGELTFEQSNEPSTTMTDVTGAYPLDVDSDGVEDLVVLRVGENILLRGLGQCRFERANERWGVDGGNEWTVSFSAKWDIGELLPTMVFGNYLALDGIGTPDTCEDHFLFQPDEALYSAPTTLSPGWCTLSILFSDWSRTGVRDLRMTNDRHYYREGEEQLWHIEPDEPPSLFTREDGWQQLQIWGMGIASHDVTGDGLPEVFLTSQGDNKMQTLDSGENEPDYRDIAFVVGATAHRPFLGDTFRPSTAWHAEFGDVNNDGFIDLFVTKGNVDAMPEFAMDDPNNLLLNMANGTFAEGAADAGLVDQKRSRGAAVVDLNLDGLLDIVVVERRVPVSMWRNTGNGAASHWLGIKLQHDGSNRDGVGSWIEVRLGGRVLQQELVVGGGHASGEMGWLHFGLGDAKEVDVRVIWPDGQVGPWSTVAVDQFVVIERENDKPTRWEPSR